MQTKVDLHGRTNHDYVYCEDCKCYSDFWKYGHNIEDAGHLGHNWRYVSDAELEECVKDCEQLTPRCPECGSIIQTELAYCKSNCPSCGWEIDVKAIQYTNCFTED